MSVWVGQEHLVRVLYLVQLLYCSARIVIEYTLTEKLLCVQIELRLVVTEHFLRLLCLWQDLLVRRLRFLVSTIVPLHRLGHLCTCQEA